jgi:hypothetical protein
MRVAMQTDPGALQIELGHGEEVNGRESGCQDQKSHCTPVDSSREKALQGALGPVVGKVAVHYLLSRLVTSFSYLYAPEQNQPITNHFLTETKYVKAWNAVWNATWEKGEAIFQTTTEG